MQPAYASTTRFYKKNSCETKEFLGKKCKQKWKYQNDFQDAVAQLGLQLTISLGELLIKKSNLISLVSPEI